MTPRRIRTASLAATLLAALLAGRAGGGEDAKAEGVAFWCGFESWDGRPAEPADAAAAAETARRRCEHAGYAGVTVRVEERELRVRVPAEHSGAEAAVRRLFERRGTVAFRVRAEESVEQEYRERRLEANVTPPLAYQWVADPRATFDGLIETPERVTSGRLDALEKKGVKRDTDEWKAAAAEHESTVRENVFANADVASAEVCRSISTWGAQSSLRIAVRFEFREERKEPFERFTGRHVGRELCVVVDGAVLSSPVIRSALPGAGELTGPGAGFTEEQASEIAAFLGCGDLAVRFLPGKAGAR